MSSVRNGGVMGYGTRPVRKGARAGTVRRAAGATVERLESRTLLAATVQTVTTMGFNMQRAYDHLAEMNSGVVFTEWFAGMMGITQGTPATTTWLHTFTSGLEPDELVSAGNRVFFRRQYVGPDNELWSTDGTVAGTTKITAAGLVSDIGAHFAWGNKLFFAGKNASGMIYPWISDGTSAGTFPLVDSPLSIAEWMVVTPTVMGGKLYFATDNGTELYESDGTRAGTHIVPTPSLFFPIDKMSNVGGKLLISDAFSLWTCTTSGVMENLGSYFDIKEMTPMDGVVYFNANLDSAGYQLHRTDGTAAGTYLVAAVSPGNYSFFLPRAAGNKLFFVGHTAAEGDEWWVTDGTLAGSHLITDLTPGTGNTDVVYPYGIAVCAGSIYFEHNDGVHGSELWTTDGTAAGTRLVQDLNPGSASASPQTITATANGVYFNSCNVGNGGLFKYDPMLPPVATIEGTPTASVGGGPMTIQIRWTDDEGVDTSTLGNNDISVTILGGTAVSATFISYTGTSKNLVATYQIPAPGWSGWDFTYSGTYQVQTTDGEVSDIGRRAVAADLIGSFDMTFAPPVVSNPLVINGTNGNDDIFVASGGGVLSVILNDVLTNYRLSDVIGIQLNGLDGYDVLSAHGLAMPITINGGLGNDWIYGGQGNDLLNGDTGQDTINGGPGNDTIDGGADADSLIGGGGVDVFVGTPTDVSLSANAVLEQRPVGTIVGTLSSTDPDVGETFTYALVSGTGATDNASFQIAGNVLKTTAPLNYETKSSYSIRVRTTDTDGLFTEKVFAINVTDVNEAPTSMQLSPTSVAENMPVGTTVGNLSVTDPDVGETYSYEILPGVDQGAFAIAGNQLTTAVRFDYEAKRDHAITVRVHDGAFTYDQSLTISVNNVNEAPTGITLSNTSVAENLAAGTTVGALAAIDPDTIGSYSYEILPGGDAGAFTLSGSQLKTAMSFNYESKASYSITVRVHDGVYTLDQPLTIDVIDVNEPPMNITLSSTSVPENQSIGTVVSILSTTDPDVGESYSYELLPAGDAASFAIVGNQLRTAGLFDYESKVNYAITVRVYDGMFTQDNSFTITVTNLVEFGMLQGKARPATIHDSDGDLVTFALKGGGTGTIQPGNRVTLDGTTAKSALSVKVKKIKGGSGDGLYHLTGITSDGLIKGVAGTAVMLSGDVFLNTLDRDPGKVALSMKVRQISDANICVQRLPVSSLAVTGDVSSSRIMTTGSIKKMSAATLLGSDILVGVATGFGGDCVETAGDFANSAATLGSLKIAGRKLPSSASHPAYVAGSHISAPTVGTLTLLNVPGASGPVVHVLNDVGTLKVSQSKLTSEEMFDGGTWNAAGARPAIWDVV